MERKWEESGGEIMEGREREKEGGGERERETMNGRGLDTQNVFAVYTYCLYIKWLINFPFPGFDVIAR